jgi:hypothetical protein
MLGRCFYWWRSERGVFPRGFLSISAAWSLGKDACCLFFSLLGNPTPKRDSPKRFLRDFNFISRLVYRVLNLQFLILFLGNNNGR